MTTISSMMVDIIRDIRQHLTSASSGRSKQRTQAEALLSASPSPPPPAGGRGGAVGRRASQPAIVGDGRRNAYSVWRVIVALAVAIFFSLAAIDAARQLRGRTAEINAEIQTLQEQLKQKPAIDPLQLRDRIGVLESQRLTLDNIGWFKLLAAAGIYTLALVCCACFWHDCLVTFDARAPLRVSVSAHVLGQMGKYVPGKAMVVLLRVSAVARHAGVARVPAVLAVFIDTLTMMASGATLAGVAVLLLPAEPWLRYLAAGLAVLAVIPTLPPLFRLVLKRLAVSRFGRGVEFDPLAFGWGLMLRGWLWTLAAWLLFGLSFWWIVQATPGVAAGVDGWTGYLTATATIALAMVAGFLSLIPGGAGVRELVIIALLAPLAGAGPALAAAVLARLVFLTTESVTAAITWGILRWTEPSNPDAELTTTAGTSAGDAGL